ncbi:MAG: ABC transporter ATP-binding protein [Chlamydiia bacterium]|nr:ABC transporter ATP-binding protein [Chlamydiia bacterium]
MPVVLEAKHLRKSFHDPIDVEVLKDINLDVSSGQSVAITGASGQGKSTLLHILGTLDDASGGSLEIGGHTVTPRTAPRIRNQELGFVFQSFHLLEDYSVMDNVLMPARIARQNTLPGSQAYTRAEQLLQMVGLSERKQFNTKLLSGGEKQRVSLARAFCNNPSLILADEPTGNLDKANSAHIHEILLDFVRKEGKALIVVTHDPELAQLCDRHLVLQDGVLQDKCY